MSTQNIQGVIQTVLQGDTQKNALDFITFLGANEISLTVSDNYVDAHHLGKNVCSVLITGENQMPGPWTIWSDQEPGSWIAWSDEGDAPTQEAVSVDEHTKEVIWAHINRCASCGGDCSPGKTKTVLGKSFDGLCSSAIAFTDPDAQALDCAKKMVMARKNDICNAASAG